MPSAMKNKRSEDGESGGEQLPQQFPLQPDSLSQPSLQHLPKEPTLSRTQSFEISGREGGLKSAREFLGHIKTNLGNSLTSTNSNNVEGNDNVEEGQPSRVVAQRSLSIDIDEELAKLDLETFDDFAGTSSTATSACGVPPTEDKNFSNHSASNGDTNPVSKDELFIKRETIQEKLVNDTKVKYNYNDKGSGNIKNGLAISELQQDYDSSHSTGRKNLPLNVLNQATQPSVYEGGAVKSSPSKMERGKVQLNGNAVVPGPSRAVGSRSEVTIPGSVQDTTALRSELITAVESNKLEKARRILKAGVDANAVCDDKGRFPLHIAAFYGFTNMCKLLLDHGAQKDQPDTALERTPLLYAAATSPETLKLLLEYKADIHSRNRFGAGCLHYAAGASQGECCRILAAVGCDVNQRDRQKMTPLHMAARVDDTWSIEVLLEFNADVHARDVLGKTCLMHAAETSEGMVSDYKKMGATFRRLVAAGVDVNATDNDGKNALYYAIQTGSPEAVTILHELGADLIDGVSLLTMGKRFPALIRPFLDKCVSSNVETCDAESKNFYIQFDYTCLTFYPKDIPDEKLLTMQVRDETESVLAEMGVLHGLTRCKDSSILSHPVCESLLRLKWKKVKWYLYLDMLLFAVFLAFLTAVIFMEYESDSTELAEDNSTEVNSAIHGNNASRAAVAAGLSHSHRSSYCMDSTRNIVVWVILWVLTACLGIREMVQLIQAPLHYVVQVENILELVLVFSVAMLSLAECGVQSFVNARDHFAAVCLIVGWTIQVTLYGKIPVFGVYIRMFAAVATNILKCMFTYLGLLFAFSLTLHFLFRSQKEFDSVGFTFLKTFAMMIGEIELARTFIDNRDNTYIVPFTSHLMFALFIIFISVILMSLLVALAVCDIASMQREGEYMQLVQQVKVASQLEDALQHRGLLYPQFAMKDHRALHQRKGVIFPNLKDHGKLGKDALEIVVTLHAKKLDASNANAISQQQIHVEESAEPKKGIGTRATNEMVDELMQKLKAKMDSHAVDLEKRSDHFFHDFRVVHERVNLHLSREVLFIKSQIEEVRKNHTTILEEMKELTVTVKALVERSLYESSSSPARGGKRHRSIDAGTGTDFNPTSPELEVTETSTQSSPEPSNSNSHRASMTPSPARNRNQPPSPNPTKN